MGRAKQLLLLDGQPLVAHVVTAALASVVDEVIVVVGHQSDAVRQALSAWAARIRVVVNRDYDRGQSTSLRAGLAAAPATAAAAVVLLADQPGVAAADIDVVLRAFRAGDHLAARAAYADGIAGHPTVIGRALWPEIGEVEGDRGARDVLARHAAAVALVPIEKAAPPDVDTEKDYQCLVDAFRQRR